MELTGTVKSICHRITRNQKPFITIKLSHAQKHEAGLNMEHLKVGMGDVTVNVFKPWLFDKICKGKEIGLRGEYNPRYKSVMLEDLVDPSRLHFKSYCE